MKIIAKIKNDFKEKFGIPRQSGITEALSSRIVFEPEYRVKEALRGIDGYSHLWLIWEFSESVRDTWSPTVRPPRLGGNKRMGVFATRSPFRPNPIGLSTCTHFIANGSGASAQTISNRELHRQRCATLLIEAADSLMKKYGADGVVMAGDYNCNRTSKEYKIMAEGLNSARELAPVRVNMEYMTSCSVGKAPSNTADKAIDHVFYSKTGVVAKHFEAIITPMSYAYSDHVPVVFDFELN